MQKQCSDMLKSWSVSPNEQIMVVEMPMSWHNGNHARLNEMNLRKEWNEGGEEWMNEGNEWRKEWMNQRIGEWLSQWKDAYISTWMTDSMKHSTNESMNPSKSISQSMKSRMTLCISEPINPRKVRQSIHECMKHWIHGSAKKEPINQGFKEKWTIESQCFNENKNHWTNKSMKQWSNELAMSQWMQSPRSKEIMKHETVNECNEKTWHEMTNQNYIKWHGMKWNEMELKYGANTWMNEQRNKWNETKQNELNWTKMGWNETKWMND